MPRLPDDGEAVLGTRAIPHVCRVPAAGQELCWGHRRPRPGWWALWLEAWPSEGGGGWAAAGFGLGAATWMGGWEAGKDFRRPGDSAAHRGKAAVSPGGLGVCQGCYNRGGASRGRWGRPPCPPSCREGFCVPFLGGDMQALPVSIYRFF